MLLCLSCFLLIFMQPNVLMCANRFKPCTLPAKHMVTEASWRVRAERERERAHEVSSPRRAAGAQRARMPASSAIFRHQRHETPLQMQTDPGKPLLSRLWKARTRAPAPNLEKYPTTLNIHGNPGLHKGPENPTFPSNGKVLGDTPCVAACRHTFPFEDFYPVRDGVLL